METAAMVEAGLGGLPEGPHPAAAVLGELADMWAPLAVALAALAALPCLLLRRRLRRRSAVASAYPDFDSDVDSSSDSDDAVAGSDREEDEVEEQEEEEVTRVGYCDGSEGQVGEFPWGGPVVRTWQGQGLGSRPVAGDVAGEVAAVRLWDARTASGAAGAAEPVLRRRAAAASGEELWDAADGEACGRRAAPAVPPVVVRWCRDVARRFPILPSPK